MVRLQCSAMGVKGKAYFALALGAIVWENFGRMKESGRPRRGSGSVTKINK